MSAVPAVSTTAEPAPIDLADLPSMPMAAMSIVRICDDPEAGLDDLSSAVSLDPALAAQILRLANSAAYRRGDEITSVDRAMMQLGLKVVKLTALGFVVSTNVSDRLDVSPELERQAWHQCLVEAVACRELAGLAGVRATSEAFLSGLFDGLGRILGLVARPAEYAELIRATPWPDAGAERQCLGMTTTEVVRGALATWGVPTLYSEVLAWTDAGLVAFGTSEVDRLAAVLTVARHATRQVLGDPGSHDALADVALASLGLEVNAVDTIAHQLATHVSDLAATLHLTLGEIPDYQALLDQARSQLISTSMQIAEEAAGQSERIHDLQAVHESLRHDAMTDRLTGLANRASFDDAFRVIVDDRVMGRTRSGALGVAMIDIDHFKAVNDTHGHQCGDHVLAEVGRRLAEVTRADEMIARYGGEEFVLVAPIVDNTRGLASLAERFRNAIAELRIDYHDVTLKVTVSVGAFATTSVNGSEPARTLVEGADRLLYDAKNGGRNTTRIHFVS